MKIEKYLKKYDKLLFVLALIIPSFLVFRSLFLKGSLVWGDAPFFYTENFRELVSKPYVWTARDNDFGGINRFLFMYPLMFVYGILNKIFAVGNDFFVRIYFYSPSLLLAFLTPLLLTKYLGYGRKVRFFSALIYVFNTYFILLVDGGQLGTILAYSLFPLSILGIRSYIDKPRIGKYLFALTTLTLTSLGDPRISIVSMFTVFIWIIFEGISVKKLYCLLFTIAGYLLISAYWLLPLLSVPDIQLSTTVSKLGFYSLLNGLFLFQPHWPGNIFGEVSPPVYYFALIPIFIFGGLLVKKGKKDIIIALLFLIFVFLTKGETPPLGKPYGFFVSRLPFGYAFRDSSKFFLPLLLFAGILIGRTVEKVNKRWIAVLAYLYLIFTVNPAIFGKLNFVLSSRSHSKDFSVIYDVLSKEKMFARSLWFPERHPLAYNTSNHPALDAKDLVDERPFASINVGSFDRFNFLHNKQYQEWLNILGIKYLIFSGDHRVVSLDEEQRENWEDLLSVVAGESQLSKEYFGKEVQVYSFSDIKPNIYLVDRLVVVVGGDDVYEKFQGNISNNAFVFAEDGKFYPNYLLNDDLGSVAVVFNNKDEVDLAASFLKDKFIGTDESSHSDWAYYESSEYLLWKYQLLIREIETKEYNYNRGISLSTESGEEIEFQLPVADDGNYVVMIRSLSKDPDDVLEVELDKDEDVIENSRPGSFKWFVKHLSLGKGTHTLKLTNVGGLHVIGLVGLVPEEDWEEARVFTEALLDKYDSYSVEEISVINDGSNWKEIAVEKVNPVKFILKSSDQTGWVIFTDRYHQSWKLRDEGSSGQSVPVYSMINGFYLPDVETEYELVFVGQKYVKTGGIVTIISIVTLLIIYSWFLYRKNDKPIIKN